MNKLDRKDFTIAVKTGSDANKSKFAKEAVKGEAYYATDSENLYFAQSTAGVSDATLMQFEPSALSFQNNYSLSFDGVDDYLEVGNYSDYNFGSGGTDSSFSISAWVKMSDATDFVVAAKDDGTSNRQYTIRFVGDKIHFYLLGGGYIGRSYSAAVTSDQGAWIHVCFTYDGSKSDTGIKIYRNGTRVDDTNYSGGSYVGMSATSASFNIGKQGVLHSAGLIDEVAIFNSALSASDISSIYRTPDHIYSSLSPLGWWRMGDNDNGTGTTITDQGSGGNDATLTNGPTFSTDVP